jgi:hypothetical protein
MVVSHILHIMYQPHLPLKLSPLLRKQLVEKSSRSLDLYHWIRCPIVAFYNYFMWLGFVASVAMFQLTSIVVTP